MKTSSFPPRADELSGVGAVSGLGGGPSAPQASCPNPGAVGGQFQTDERFATIQRWLTRFEIAVAIVAVVWMVLPAVLMWLAGGTPA